MKQHFKNIFVGCVILCLIIAGLDLVIDNPYSQKFLASYIGKLIAQETNVSVNFESLNLNLLPIEANLFGVQVLTESTSHKTAIAEAIQVKIRVSPLSLFFGKPKISLYIDGLNLRWPPPPDFKGFLKEGPHQAKTRSDNAWPLQNIALRNAQFFIDLSQNHPNSRVSFVGVNLDVNFKESSIFNGKIAVHATDLVISGKPYLEGTQFATAIRMTRDIFSMDEVSITDRLFKLTANLKGTLSLQDPNARYIRLNGMVDTKANLSILEKIVGLKNTHGHGKVSTKLFIHIPFAKPEDIAFFADGSAEALDGYIDGNRIYNTQARFFADNDGVKLKDAKVIIGKTQHALLNGTIDFNRSVDFHFTGHVSQFPLSTIIASFGGNFDKVDFKASSDNIAFSGTGEPFKMELTAQVAMQDLDFPPLKIPRTRFHQLPSCRANVNLSINPKRLNFNDSDALCFLVPAGHVTVPLKDKNLVAPEHAQNASKIQIRNYVDFDTGPQLSILGKNISLALARSYLQVELSGMADVVTRISDKNGIVAVNTDFTAQAIAVEKVKLANIKGSLVVVDKALKWTNVQASNNKLTATSENGSYAWDNDILSFRLRAQNMDQEFISDLIALLDHSGVKRLRFAVKNLNGQFQIPLRNLSQSRNTVQADLSSVQFENRELIKELSFTGDQDRNSFHFSSVQALIGSLPLRGYLKYKKNAYDQIFSGNDELEANFTSDASSKDQNDFNKLPYVSEYIQALKLSGLIDLNGKLYGKLMQLNGFFNVNVAKFASEHYPLYPLSIKGFVNNSQVQVFASQPGDSFLARLDFNFVKPGIPFKWHFNLKQFDMRAFMIPDFLRDARNYAYLTAQWTLAGTLMNWWQSEGKLQLDDMSMAFFPPTQTGATSKALFVKTIQPTSILITRKAWTLENGHSFKLAGSGTRVELGLEHSKPPERLGIFVKSSLDLAILARLFPQIQSGSGTLAMDTTIDGSLDTMKIKSHIYNERNASGTPTALSLLLPDFSPALQDIKVDMTYENESLLIKELTARKGKGQLAFTGQIYFAENLSKKVSEVKINLNQASFDLAVPYLKSIHSVLSGDIIISGNHRPFDVIGNVKIIRAQTDRFLDIETEAIKEYSAHHIGPSFQEASNPLFHFNLGIEASKAIAIQSKSLSVTMSSNVVLKGTEDKPLLSGNVLVDQGRFRYKRDFVISRGELIFDNPLRNDPKVDITATAQISTYTVTIFISSNASKPLVDIIVDPPTKDDGSPISRLDAIVLLSTGRVPDTEISRSQDARNVVVTTGLNLYASQLPFDKFNELTGQKYISPYVNYTTDAQGNPVPQLNVPIYITDLIEAIFQQNPTQTSATIQVPLHDNINLSGSATSTQRTQDVQTEENQTQSGVDLKFSFPFK